MEQEKKQSLKYDVLIRKYFFLQLRETVNNFCQKELAPYADQIDKENNFPHLRVSVKQNLKKITWIPACLGTTKCLSCSSLMILAWSLTNHVRESEEFLARKENALCQMTRQDIFQALLYHKWFGFYWILFFSFIQVLFKFNCYFYSTGFLEKSR